ncbi:MAG: 3-dehydroquinate synthase [Ruminococcus sp.]
MRVIDVTASSNYKVYIEKGIIDRAGDYAKEICTGTKALIISDSNVAPLYADRVKKSLEEKGFEVYTYVIDAGEASKNPENLVGAANFCIESSLTRKDLIVALGGGVITDLGGLCGAMYQRGVTVMQIPTSLLAMVDSSVGGKTAVNLQSGKNMFGVFYQPAVVICDSDALSTLPEEEVSNGMAEVIKYAVLRGGKLTDILKNDGIKPYYDELIEECISIKRDYVSADEFDHGDRQFLNLGHTIGHAIERKSNFSVAHGSAVSAGMCIMSRACQAMNICSASTTEYIESACKRFGLPTNTEISIKELFEASHNDKKCSSDNVTLIMIRGVGDCCLSKTKIEDLERIIQLGVEG